MGVAVFPLHVRGAQRLQEQCYSSSLNPSTDTRIPFQTVLRSSWEVAMLRSGDLKSTRPNFKDSSATRRPLNELDKVNLEFLTSYP